MVQYPERDVLIRYYICGRKEQMSKSSAAELAQIINARTGRNVVESYLCPYENHFHVGRPTQGKITQEFLGSAKKEWRKAIKAGKLTTSTR